MILLQNPDRLTVDDTTSRAGCEALSFSVDHQFHIADRLEYKATDGATKNL
jgi:hypothetical protein